MEKPIEYYEESLRYARKERVPICHTEHGELIAMVKARDNEIARLNGQSMFLCQCGGVNSLAAENVNLQTQFDQQLCVTRTLEKEIAELKQDAIRLNAIEKKPHFLRLYRGRFSFDNPLSNYGYETFKTLREAIDSAIASQQDGEVK